MSSVGGSVRLWILAVALGSFAAGVVLGVAVPELWAQGRHEQTPEEDYVHEMATRYGLNAAQTRSLRLVLQHDRERQLEILRTADWSQLPPELQNRRLKEQRATELRILQILDERQRALYERDSRPAGGATVGGGTPESIGPGDRPTAEYR
ncbi:MAG: hypothetical protein H6835_16120 [Planctomycetes bacterium]|nr:hypothetical protein [Planctomycetota bacterium]